ncbi:hypothetical protein AVEN_272982-1 [Araneus ventricosus]|uniref:Uncharacterized protein n=1 Tax=Araneus ventricosus TaxID=182803 RepID=A0A4Y2IEG9_ARAVE|nr:hypothetical protein AVEN_272982-1 [Araneus ventricosus]
MTNSSALIYELVVLPDCHFPILQLTGTLVKTEHLIEKRDRAKEDKRKLWQLKKAEINMTKLSKPAKNSTKKKKVSKRHLDF